MSQTLFTHVLNIAEHQHMVRISSLIRQDIVQSQVQEGIAVVYCPHTSAGITVNENADPDVIRDVIYGMERAFPSVLRNYRHAGGNSHAHLKSTVCGNEVTLIILGGKPILGQWQDVYFCEFDGPRERTFYVKIIEG